MARGGGERRVRQPDRIIADLNAEWDTLGDGGEVADWSTRHPSLRGCADLATVLAAIRTDPDGVLGALLQESAAGSLLAGRTVLQAMLGKIVLMAHHDPVVSTYGCVAAMWERIRTYPLDRRPVHIAGNLALDARKLARREAVRDRHVTPWPPGAAFAELIDRQCTRNGFESADTSVLTAGDVITAALQLQLIDAAAGEVLGVVYADGLSSVEASQRLLTTPQMVRQRCSTALRRLAPHAHELARLA